MKLENHAILVAERDYWPLLFSWKKAHPQLDVKFMDPEELLDAASFSYSTDPIPLLLQHGYDYSRAKKWKRLLRVIDASKNEKAQNVDVLCAPFKTKDPLRLRLLQTRKLYLLEFPESDEICLLLKRKDIVFSLLSLADLEFPAVFDLEHGDYEIGNYRNKFQQFFAIFSAIRQRLLAHPEEAGRVKIHIHGQEDLLYVRLCSSLFQMPVYCKIRRYMMELPSVSAELKRIHKTRIMAVENSSRDPHLKTLEQIMDTYGLASLPFDAAYASLLEILSSNSTNDVEENQGIAVVEDFSFDPDAILYLSDFQYDRFYHEATDRNVLSDDLLVSVGANPSYVETQKDRNKKYLYLIYQNIAHLSRVREHLQDRIFDSQFIAEYELGNKIKIAPFLPSGTYTSLASTLSICDQYDKAFYAKEKPGEVYFSYHHEFQKIDHYSLKPKSWSITNLESYVSCPYAYYLQSVIPTDFDPHASCLGTLGHAVFEKVHTKDYSFEDAFSGGARLYRQQFEKMGWSWSKKEDAILEVAKTWMRRFADAARQWKMPGYIDDSHEQAIAWTIKDNEGHPYRFSGRIDKIIYFGDANSSYYGIIDYKTGAENLEIMSAFLGKSTQLPLYYYALSNPELCAESKTLTEGKEFGFFGISHIYESSAKKAFERYDGFFSRKGLAKTMRIGGVVKKDSSLFDLADPTAFKNGELKEKAPLFLGLAHTFTDKDQGDIVQARGVVYDYPLSRYIQEAVDGTLATIHHIENGEFPIAPTATHPMSGTEPGNLHCAYCGYRDICYVNKGKDARDLKAEILEHFAPLRQRSVANNGDKKEGK